MRCELAFVLSLVSIAAVTGSSVLSEDQHSVNGTWTWPPWDPFHHKTTSTTPPSTSTTTTSTTPPSTSTTTTSTTPPSNTTTSTTPPSTTTTTTSTTPPSTSTTSTTPPSTTTTSTTPPSNTTTTTPTPTPAPKPAPKDYGNWTVIGDNGTCIMLQAALSLNVKYPLINKMEGHATVAIPNNATSNGTCSNSTQSLNLYWGGHQAVLRFTKMGTSGQYDLQNVSVTLIADNSTFVNISKDITKIQLQSSSSQFTTPLSYSYQCSAPKSVPLANATALNGTLIGGSLDFKKLHLQAFMESKEARFGAPEDCDEDASDIVPIVVGCALAALIVVILGVYVWGRRRSLSRGYVSM